MNKKQSLALIAETPYQLLNCINMAMGFSNTDMSIDLYLGNRFSTFSDVLIKLRRLSDEYAFFDNIIAYSYDNVEKSCVISPRKFLNQCVGEQNTDGFLQYTCLYTSVVTRMTVALLRLNPKCKLFFYDDGLGSYFGNINLYNLSWPLKVLLAITGCYSKILKPSALYLNNVSLCDSKISTSILPLPPLDFDNSNSINICNQLFGNIPDIYSHCRTIFLTQPFDTKNESLKNCFAENTRNILACFKKNDYVLRLHPRDKGNYDRMNNVDSRGVLWEYICGRVISDSNILITQFSTAAFSPKFFFDKEPYIIFTCYLYETGLFYSDINSIVKQIEKIKSIYRNPRKIFTPMNLSEFETIIKELC